VGDGALLICRNRLQETVFLKGIMGRQAGAR
jgi:hypothetical protein